MGETISRPTGVAYVLHVLVAFVVTMTFLDHWTTYLCLRQPVAGWDITEFNPLAAWLFERMGLVEGLLFDTALTLTAIIFLVWSRMLPRNVKFVFFFLVAGGTTLAVFNNLEALRKLGLSPFGVE